MGKRNGGVMDGLDTQMTRIQTEYYAEFGSVVAESNPAFGDYLTAHDPRDYVQLYRSEGLHPTGLVQQAWMIKQYCELRGHDTVAAFFTQGEEWRRLRSSLAADLMQPKAARTYLPMINLAVEQACHGLEDHEGTLDKFVTLLAFDMFSALSLGSILNESKFVQDSQLAFELVGQMFQLQPEERSTHPLWFKFVVAMDDAQARAHQLVTEVVEALESGTASGMQQQSYVAKLVDRGDLSRDEIVPMLMLLLQAGGDTTASFTNMLLINIASNPRVQDKLRDEILSVCPSGDVTEEHLKQMPYLKACIRESHRLTPSVTVGTVRPAPRDMVVSGYEIPEGALVMTDTHCIQNNPDLMDYVNEFLPERWSQQAVQARKGTEKEVCDHALLRDSFGMGARSCLGQRVAKLEIQVATARLIREHRLELPEGQTWQIRMSPFAKAEPFPNIKLSSVA